MHAREDEAKYDNESVYEDEDEACTFVCTFVRLSEKETIRAACM